MHRQTEQRAVRLLETVPEPTACAAVAVVAGEGNRRLFASLGATTIVEGGQSMNPSVGDLARAIEDAHERDVVLLPNNPNVLSSAEQAAEYTQVQAEVIPTRSIQEGLAAMVAFDSMRSREENAAEMGAAIEGVATGEITIASRDAVLNGLAVRKGNYFGLAGGDPVAQGESFDEVARAVVERLLAEPREVLTLLRGADAPQLDRLVAELAERHPELEVDVQDGGQPHYPLLVSAE
jgi:dihydroxyacetone kinase-like predicted kinase